MNNLKLIDFMILVSMIAAFFAPATPSDERYIPATFLCALLLLIKFFIWLFKKIIR